MSDRTTVTCHACGAALEVPSPVSRRESCEACGADVRCCLNCGFHDASAYNECREPSAERVLEKDRSNHCDFFAPTATTAAKPPRAASSRNELENLFKKK